MVYNFTGAGEQIAFDIFCIDEGGLTAEHWDNLNPHMKVQNIEAVKRCVMNNLGIAVVPTYSIGEELKNGSLMPVKTELDEKLYDWISPQMELALDLLKRYLGSEQNIKNEIES